LGPDCLTAIFPDLHDKKKLMRLMIGIDVVDEAAFRCKRQRNSCF